MIDKILTNCNKVIRIEIINTAGKREIITSYNTTVQLQDMGLTLKIFINDRPFTEAANG